MLAMIVIENSFCRICTNYCAIKVTIEDGAAVRVQGDRANPIYRGYTCVKGRSQSGYLHQGDRLLHSLKRADDGTLCPIPISDAMDEIAAELTVLIERHGPRSVAAYSGTMACATFPTANPLYAALLDAIGTPMRFDPNTLDKGGKQVAQSFLGTWGAPAQGFDEPMAILLIGINPLVTYTGFPAGSPHTWLAERLDAGCALVVIDPRKSEVAKKATLHLQPAPGHDVPILAAMIHVIVEERLYDVEFITRWVDHIGELREVVRSFDPESVAVAAGIDPRDLRLAARLYATASRGYTMAGTGPNMSGSGTLLEYLVLVIETLCGRWMRAGEVVKNAASLIPGPVSYVAGARGPRDWRKRQVLKTRNLRESRAGMPTSALADEILADDEDHVRALISWAGNPAIAFPDQRKTVAALKRLELLVQIDPWMSETSRLARYVIAPRMPLESASVTSMLDSLAARGTGYGSGTAYAQYTPALAAVPERSDLIEDWEFFYGLMVRMGYGVTVRAAGTNRRVPPVTLDSKPTTEELIELLSAGARIPLARVKAERGGAIFTEDLPVVASASDRADGRLDVGHPEMLDALIAHGNRPSIEKSDADYPFRLLCRRHNHTYNTSCNVEATNRGVYYNPAFLHPDDMAELGITNGTTVRIRSSLAAIDAVAEADPSLRRGVVSMAFGYGTHSSAADDVRRRGSSPNRLVPVNVVFDPYTGQPRMSNLPVAIEASTDRSPGPSQL
jgi:anaerobic selenocysteine-containing dehydrogenase